MDFPAIYLVILVGYGMMVFGISIKNFAITILSCFLLFALSVHAFKYGISIFEYNSLISIVFSTVTFGIAAYVSLKSSLEMIT